MPRSLLSESSQGQYFQRWYDQNIKALKLSAFFRARNIYYFCVLLLLVTETVFADTHCQTKNYDQTVTVRSVVDGDTLRLSNGQLVRFIGINTPEIDHQGYDSQPFAKQARDTLRQLAPVNRRVHLVYGLESKDRHKRQLAHIFTLSGDNIQQKILQQGMGVWIAVPPNLGFADCYKQAEQLARSKKIGIWRHGFYQPTQVKTAKQFNRGFQFIRGRIYAIEQEGAWFLLKLTENLALKVHADKLKYFPNKSLRQYQNKSVTVRGWLYPKLGQWQMTVKHPAAIENDT